MHNLSMFCLLIVLPVYVTALTGCTGGSHASERLGQTAPQVKASSFAGPQNAWLVGSSGDLWRTNDGGSSWVKIPGKAVGGRFYNVSFIDAKRGWAAGEHGVVWHTVDGGLTWNDIGKLSIPGRGDWVFMGSPQMHFVDAKHGWLIETLGIWRTEDSGVHWRLVLSTLDERVNGQPVSGVFKSASAAIVSGTGGEIYATDDGGESWRVKVSTEMGDFRYVNFLDEHTGWLIGSGAQQHGTLVWSTENGGQSWQPVTSLSAGASIYSLDFIDNKEGWAVGRALNNYRDGRLSQLGLVLHTVDGGETWEPVRVGGNEEFFNKVSFLNRQHGWLFSREKVYRTNDSGKTWDVVLDFNHS